MKYLSKINSPADLKKLNLSQLPEVAVEIRDFIIKTLADSPCGGHFGGPLGAVDICVALHYVFNSPKDKIVFDVGYQAYAHKILTGRRDRFHTLRQKNGIAPFPRLEESEHDTNSPGHGSTSISQALGYAVARDLQGGKESVVAVIGDGSMVGGLALEGLHQGGHQKSDLIVILNDNEMGISHNYSSLATYLRRVRTDPIYKNTRQSLEEIFKKLPGGEIVIEVGHKLRAGVRSMVVPGLWFEELGYHYIGPINGHNYSELIAALKTARALGGPVLIHTVTVKGKGFEKAEKEDGQIKWHAATPAELEKAGFGSNKADNLQEDSATLVKPKSAPPSYTQVFSDTLCELAQKDDKIVAITAAMPGGTGIDQFIEKFPGRGFDVGMTEEHAVTFASGLALRGLRPVVAIYSTFMQRGYDQIIHDVCQHTKGGLPVTFALDRGGLVGEDGATHQGVMDLTYLRSIPHLTVMAPKDELELRSMLATCLSLDGPAAIRYPRGTGVGHDLSAPYEAMPVGIGELIYDDENPDVGVIAIGYSVQMALGAVEKLRAQGHKVALFNARFVKPLDENGICDLAKRCKRLVTIEENARLGGFGSAVLECLQRHEILVPTEIVGIPDEFIHHASPKIQRAELGLDGDGIEATIVKNLAKIQYSTAKNESNSTKNGAIEKNGAANGAKALVEVKASS
ncbi:1-deoxy-D-xylulose-5-phosphate synthase [Abditibacterium utsteinense]|uniref:1-deoxy-D-xylulose-5-phosphate synthase n=1 Tax=Abditibacterium utsteinense TaxID=1960156 RepID=A0A2S8SRH4_9BACT|nr:1-deoxy-D-xylulose-5-phosphate synthase [Abditibacterium utsteinense]PQV63378.1 1-deoxy-D-xylulose-5-phosphate synthase [Abditibacterium utsteinense]